MAGVASVCLPTNWAGPSPSRKSLNWLLAPRFTPEKIKLTHTHTHTEHLDAWWKKSCLKHVSDISTPAELSISGLRLYTVSRRWYLAAHFAAFRRNLQLLCRSFNSITSDFAPDWALFCFSVLIMLHSVYCQSPDTYMQRWHHMPGLLPPCLPPKHIGSRHY